MSAARDVTVAKLVAEGFAVSTRSKDVVRVARGNDKRIVMPDGSQKRSNHTHYQAAGARR